eukprot:1650696-Prymnesium_polylepis.3
MPRATGARALEVRGQCRQELPDDLRPNARRHATCTAMLGSTLLTAVGLQETSHGALAFTYAMVRGIAMAP